MENKVAAQNENESLKVAIYKDPNASIEDRLDDLLSRMTIAEKAAQMMGVWNEKKETLIDEKGNFDFEKPVKRLLMAMESVRLAAQVMQVKMKKQVMKQDSMPAKPLSSPMPFKSFS